MNILELFLPDCLYLLSYLRLFLANISIFATVMKMMSYVNMCVKPSEQIGFHEHPSWELSYVTSGHGLRAMGSRQEHFRPGEVILVPPNLRHCWTFDGEDETISCITVLFHHDLVSILESQFPEMTEVANRFSQITEAVSFTGSTLTRLQTELTRMDDMSAAGRFAALLGLLVTIAQSDEQHSVGRQYTETELRLKRIEVYIDCNYNHDINIDSIASHIGMNRSSLCTFFRRHTGMTLIEAVNARRLEVARNLLLRRSDLSIQQVCFESGFKDIPYFFRLFKRAEGITPRMYRHGEGAKAVRKSKQDYSSYNELFSGYND